MVELTDERVLEYWERMNPLFRGLAFKHYRLNKEQYPTLLDFQREVIEDFLGEDSKALKKLPAMRVFLSRHSHELKPGMGDSIDWNIGETVEIISGIDKGRLFVVETTGMAHNDAPGEYVREGHFVDGRDGRCAKREKDMWFVDAD